MVIYNSAKDPVTKLDSGLIKLGTYELDFDVRLIPAGLLPIPQDIAGHTVTIGGKRAIIESLQYESGEKKFLGVPYGVGLTKATLRVKVLENPIPLLGFVLAVGALIGAAALLCREVRLLVVENPVVGAGLGIGLIVLTVLGVKRILTERIL